MAVVERGKLRGRAQEWNISRTDMKVRPLLQQSAGMTRRYAGIGPKYHNSISRMVDYPVSPVHEQRKLLQGSQANIHYLLGYRIRSPEGVSPGLETSAIVIITWKCAGLA